MDIDFKRVLPFIILVLILVHFAYITDGFGGIVPGFSSQGYSGALFDPEGFKCVDSDKGVKPYKFGRVDQGSPGNLDYKNDICSDDNVLTEYYCEGGLPKSKKINCEFGCEGGKCNRNQNEPGFVHFLKDLLNV